MQKYIKNYYKYSILYKEGMIDADIYNACIEKLLRDSHVIIDESDTSKSDTPPLSSLDE